MLPLLLRSARMLTLDERCQQIGIEPEVCLKYTSSAPEALTCDVYRGCNDNTSVGSGKINVVDLLRIVKEIKAGKKDGEKTKKCESVPASTAGQCTCSSAPNTQCHDVTVTRVQYSTVSIDRPITLYREMTTTVTRVRPITNYKVTTFTETVTESRKEDEKTKTKTTTSDEVPKTVTVSPTSSKTKPVESSTSYSSIPPVTVNETVTKTVTKTNPGETTPQSTRPSAVRPSSCEPGKLSCDKTYNIKLSRKEVDRLMRKKKRVRTRTIVNTVYRKKRGDVSDETVTTTVYK
ncbi:hypothetical protein ECANGB1_1301 [Enterospora canceri]|uniref:Uncharacterized protein n=1 Tax=Enterospora canceri TaxID=1081671 RepID=A0A1Y1S6E8_9MICR|nr:hypothetical protein ECANGB1_1301 [Enterospora canceri]